MASGALGEWGNRLGARVGEFSASIHFLTRLPLPRHEGSGWRRRRGELGAGRVGVSARRLRGRADRRARLSVADRLVWFAWPAAALTVAATLFVTGALHEDGLADTADGFGGGDTREKKLEIMRDARIGTYGVCALIISLLIRIAAIAGLTEPALVAVALIAAHVGARAVLPFVMFLLPAARSDGLAFAAGVPSGVGVAIAAALGFLALLVLSRAWACAGRAGGAGDRGGADVRGWRCGRSAARPATCWARSSR